MNYTEKEIEQLKGLQAELEKMGIAENLYIILPKTILMNEAYVLIEKYNIEWIVSIIERDIPIDEKRYSNFEDAKQRVLFLLKD